jgi:peptidoglycan glycosyltransferase
MTLVRIVGVRRPGRCPIDAPRKLARGVQPTDKPLRMRRSVPPRLTQRLAELALVVGLVGTLEGGARAAESRDDVNLRAAREDKSGMLAPYKHGPGEVRTTLDPKLQRAARKLLGESKAPAGAVVMSDIRTGRILVWASLGKEGDLVRRSMYPSASLFKVVTAAALLEGHHVERGNVICYSGGERRLEEGDVRPGCHSGDRKIEFGKALGKSINGVFARLGVAFLERDDLSRQASAFGLDAAPLVDVRADAGRILLPDPGASDVAFGRAAAGFHTARLSPLSALAMMQTIANGGERVQLHVLGERSNVTREVAGRALSPSTAKTLTRMLEVTTRAGTSTDAFKPAPGKPKLRVAGKTGTLATENPARLVSWFAGFAPADKPEVAITVMLANDHSWWRKANEVARDMLDVHFTKP